jgi:ribosomal protein L7/L12
MFVPLWILVPAILLLLWLLSRAFGNRGDMIERQRRAATPVSPELLAQALADPEIRAAIEGGHKIEAIRLVRERTGLDLKGAKDLVDSQAHP